jgi:pimeloyl-ACP methyl ester carboxylesterase
MSPHTRHALHLAGALSAAVLLQAIPVTTARAAPRLIAEQKVLHSAKGLTIEARSGRLEVPENRSEPGSRTIAVEFLRLGSTAKNPRAPTFYLAGGPGQRGINERPEALDFWAPFLAVSDVVLINQRGTNDTSVVWRWDGPPPLAYFLSADSAIRHVDRMSRAAAKVFRARGVDLRGYTTVENAQDLEDLRAALGLEHISLLAFSYGTHLATAYMKAHPDRVESAVLLGTEGPAETYKLPWTMDLQLQRLALLAAADPRIGPRIPDLVALYDRVVQKLDREPMIVKLQAPGGGPMLDVPVGGFGLRFILRADIGDASDLIVFPRLLWSIDHGDATLLTWFLRKRAGTVIAVHGMNEAMDVASGLSPAREALIAEQAQTSRFADVINFPHPYATEPWDVPDLGEDFRAPLVSSVRTLFVSGELDCNTPPYQAEAMRWGMTNATHLIVANAGHEQTFFQNDTAIPVIADFLAGRDVRDRRITWPPLRFVPLEGSDPLAMHPSVPR